VSSDLPNQKTVLAGEPVGRTVTRLGRYTLKQRLGVGGMAEVYLAEQDGPQQFKKRVVVKRILPSLAADASFVAMFVREAQVAARLSHANVVQIYELGEQAHDGLPGQPGGTEYFIAMEYIDGLTLQRLATASWNAGRALPVDVVVRTIADAARGLHAAHTLADDEGKPLRLVHRDISPDNLMVSKDGVTKVLDFGIAKGDLDGPKTRTGNLRGKVPYMSPEQIQGQALDGRCDLWALGVSMYWLLCGERPFDRGTDFHTMQAILQEPARRPSTINPGVPPPLEAIILKLLEKNRDARYATAAELADHLEELASPGTGSGRRTTVAFVEQFLAESHATGNPLSESGDKTSHTRPLYSGGAAPVVSGAAVDVAIATDDAAAAPRQVTLPSSPSPSAPKALAAPEASAAPPPVPTGPSTPPPPKPMSSPSGNHPVVDMLAQPKQSAIPAVLVVLVVMGLLVVGGGFAIFKVVQSTSKDDGRATRDADAGSPVATVNDAGPKVLVPPPVVDAGATVATVVDAGPEIEPVVDAGPKVAQASDAGTPVVTLPAVDAGPATPPPPTRLVVRAQAPSHIFWTLEDGTALGSGNTVLSLARGTSRVVAVDKKRNVSKTMTLTSGTITVKPLPGAKVFLGRDRLAESGAIPVVEGTYELRVTTKDGKETKKSLAIKAGQNLFLDPAKP
jgi:serine/threonine-protein kinase